MAKIDARVFKTAHDLQSAISPATAIAVATLTARRDNVTLINTTNVDMAVVIDGLDVGYIQAGASNDYGKSWAAGTVFAVYAYAGSPPTDNTTTGVIACNMYDLQT